ncbi:malonyl-ACP O-methyltransferase BioC [Marinomonas sp. A79]|uniref:Malonyl-[acyl-carrier protein] O-methyltransferase n=1 Tax=Marinomonas vulgaris TaxID=2823372 RepID=A0ABS5HAL3_9GAMM|nr:malonyl-ACP O-methyltransferase BioC [Marinomonas vulgaris]MBR7888703.1 malonyl-ACP O-methyltransferase BioC [Marinomonas vulgaris]
MLIPHETPALNYKKQLAKRFDRASYSYDAYADFQRQVLKHLLELLPTTAADVVMDLGTGTGQALESLLSIYQPQSCIALDLSQHMLSVAESRASLLERRGALHYVCADAEQLPIATSSCQLIFSSLALQWCLHPSALFAELYRATAPGGFLVFSSLCQGSMAEVRHAWRALDDQEHVHQYEPIDTLKKSVTGAGWTLMSAELSRVTMYFESAQKSIDSLKKIGASLMAKESTSAMSPSKWKAFLREYETQRDEQGVPLSYQVSYIVARKPMSSQE